MRFKNNNIKGKKMNTRCARQTWKWKFILSTYANMNITTWQGYGARSYLILVLNKLKEMRGPTSIYTPLGT
jgi:hypothetical protein